MRVMRSGTAGAPFDHVVELMRDDRLLTGIHRLEHHLDATDLRLEVPVEVETGPVTSVERPVRVAVQPFTIQAKERDHLYPILDAELEVTAVDRQTSEIAIDGSYRPPGRLIGSVVDRLLLHRIADAAIDRMFDWTIERAEQTWRAESPTRGIPL